MIFNLAVSLLAASSLAFAAPAPVKRCSATISSLSDVSAAEKCTTVTIKSFTVPAGKTFDLSNLAKGTTVTMQGTVTFAHSNWAGPLFAVGGTDITFNGNGQTFDGLGAKYWDGKGSNGGVTKPKMMKIKMAGTFKDVIVKNSPEQAFSIGSNKAALTLDSVTVDNSAGDAKGSNGKAVGHNSDCFDVSADDVTIKNSVCKNQDDCLALNSGSNFVFDSNTCSGGHGISIGSIKSGKVVDGVTISNNKVTASTNGLRIKTYNGATKASVSNVKYSGNTLSGISDYGVVIEQDYENGSPTGSASNGVPIKNVSFTGATTSVKVESDAKEVFVLCGSNTCTGTWDWSKLSTSGGSKGSVSPSSIKSLITGYSI